MGGGTGKSGERPETCAVGAIPSIEGVRRQATVVKLRGDGASRFARRRRPTGGARLAAVTSAGRASGLEPLELGPDSGAAAALFERHSAHVFRYCKSRLGKREDAEDAVQTTFLYAVRSLRLGVKPLVESAWLLGIARNVCLSRWEASGRRNRVETVCDPQELGRSAAAPQGRNEELIGLEEALARLPERQRRAVLLRDWRGLSYDEVAEQLGVTRAAVETLIFRGRERLAGLLREEPSMIRRRLTSLGNLGALVNAVKTAFAGGAAATKVAMAVTAVAVSGVGIAAGPLLDRDRPAPAGRVVAVPAVESTPRAAAQTAGDARAEHAAAVAARPGTRAARRGGRTPPAAEQRAVIASDAPAVEGLAPVAAGGPHVATPAVAAPMVTPKREASSPATPVLETSPEPQPVPVVTSAVDEVVSTVVPDLPVVAVPEVSELPVVRPVTETVVETAVGAAGSALAPPIQTQVVVPELLPAAVVTPILP